MLLGYASHLSVLPGEEITFYVSADAGTAQAQVVRLCGVSHDSSALGAAIEEVTPADLPDRLTLSRQATVSGSYFVAQLNHRVSTAVAFAIWMQPTLKKESAQTLVDINSPDDSFRLTLHLQGGGLSAVVNSGADSLVRVELPDVCRPSRWNLVGISIDLQRGELQLLSNHLTASGERLTASSVGKIQADELQMQTLTLGASQHRDGPVSDHFNGRIDRPLLLSEPLDIGGFERLADPDSRPPGDAVLASWDFSQDMHSQRIVDTGPLGLHGRVVNRPTRAVRGHEWSGDEMFWPMAPHLWSGVHFHEDDIDDAGWEETCRLRLPIDLKSGLYALKLTKGSQVEHVPFYVRARSAGNPVLFLAPTNTYLAYANERLAAGSRAGALSRVMPFPIELSDADRYLFDHPELGSSLYDRHIDESGVTYSSRLRPIVNMRPNYRTWINAGRRHFAADLYISGWLEGQAVPFDMATDEDLDRDGLDLLSRYQVVVTGSHPEYWTTPMMRAVEEFTSTGGHLMYLGGNGFYWVTAFTDEQRTSIEVRRGYSSQRNWTSHSAEVSLASTGELGGTWVHRGRAPQRLVGVGSWACGFGPGTGYTRTPASLDPEFDFVFEGVTEHPIGEYGYVLGGAAGDELDRTSDALAEGADVTVLMSSMQHDKWCWPFVETQMDITSGLGGDDNPEIRSDVVWVRRPNGSRIFSVGSICWGASMAFNEGRNGVSRLTLNVLRHLIGTNEGSA